MNHWEPEGRLCSQLPRWVPVVLTSWHYIHVLVLSPPTLIRGDLYNQQGITEMTDVISDASSR